MFDGVVSTLYEIMYLYFHYYCDYSNGSGYVYNFIIKKKWHKAYSKIYTCY